MKEMRGKAKREAVAILKKCNVLQFQGTAETMTALLLKRDVYVRASNCYCMGPAPRVRKHPAERMAGSHTRPRCKLPVVRTLVVLMVPAMRSTAAGSSCAQTRSSTE